MTKPPKSSPHSDLDGVHEDARRNVDAAVEAGEGTANLARARRESVGKPEYSDDESGRDDRSR